MAQLSRDNRLLMAAIMFWGVGEGLFAYIIPLYLRELGADPVAIGGILGAAAAVVAMTHIPAGWLSDRLGHRRLILTGFGLCVAATLLMFLAPSLSLFVPGLILYTFTGFVSAPLNAYISQSRGNQSVQGAITRVWAGYWASTMVSPFVGGLIGQQLGLRSLFGIACVIFLFAWIMMFWLRTHAIVDRKMGLTGYRQMLGNRRFMGFIALVCVALSVMHLGLPLMPNFVVEVRGYEAPLIGVLGSVNALGSFLLNTTLGHREPRRIFLLGQVLVACSLLLLISLPGLPWLVLAYGMRAGWHLAHNMAMAQISRVVDGAEIGRALGVMETAVGAGLILMPLLAGFLYERNPYWPFGLGMALTLLALPAVWWLAPRRGNDEAANRAA